MIRREATGERWLLIRQTDHALLSGTLAALWRDGGPLGASTIHAIAHHDDGWLAWEAAPKADPEKGVPIDFLGAAHEDHLLIWERGPRLVAARDPYAGVLVSLHGTGLMVMKLRMSRTLSDAERARTEAYLQGQERFRAEVAKAARIDLRAPGLKRDIALLRLLDFVSLVLCCGPAETRKLEVPDASIQMKALGEREVALAPWPFADQPAFQRSIDGAAIPKARYDDESLRAALATAPRERLTLRFSPA